MRHPVMITSLEEDFKKLGLLSEEGQPAPQHAPAPPGVPAPSKTGARNVGSGSDGADEEGKDETDEVPGHAGAVPPKAALPVTPGAQSEAVSGMPDPIRAGKVLNKKPKVEEPEAEEESIQLQGADAVMEAVSRFRGEPEPVTSTVESLIEDVNTIMDNIHDSRLSETIKAFANVSIIAEMLRKGFEGFAEAYEDQGLLDTASALAQLAEESANIAQALEEGMQVESASLEAEFRSQMEAIANGLSLYADIVEHTSSLAEKEEGDDDEEDDDKDDEKEKDDDKEKDGEDDDDEKSEALARSGLVGRDKRQAAGLKPSLAGASRPKSGAGAGIAKVGGIVSSKSESRLGKGKVKKEGAW